MQQYISDTKTKVKKTKESGSNYKSVSTQSANEMSEKVFQSSFYKERIHGKDYA